MTPATKPLSTIVLDYTGVVPVDRCPVAKGIEPNFANGLAIVQKVRPSSVKGRREPGEMRI